MEFGHGHSNCIDLFRILTYYSFFFLIIGLVVNLRKWYIMLKMYHLKQNNRMLKLHFVSNNVTVS